MDLWPSKSSCMKGEALDYYGRSNLAVIYTIAITGQRYTRILSFLRMTCCLWREYGIGIWNIKRTFVLACMAYLYFLWAKLRESVLAMACDLPVRFQNRLSWIHWLNRTRRNCQPSEPEFTRLKLRDAEIYFRTLETELPDYCFRRSNRPNDIPLWFESCYCPIFGILLYTHFL